jgi:hypothetical protein
MMGVCETFFLSLSFIFIFIFRSTIYFLYFIIVFINFFLFCLFVFFCLVYLVSACFEFVSYISVNEHFCLSVCLCNPFVQVQGCAHSHILISFTSSVKKKVNSMKSENWCWRGKMNSIARFYPHVDYVLQGDKREIVGDKNYSCCS